jgi:hypothetical protein
LRDKFATPAHELISMTEYLGREACNFLAYKGRLTSPLSGRMGDYWGADAATFTCDSSAQCCAFAGAHSIVSGDSLGRVHFLELVEKS